MLRPESKEFHPYIPRKKQSVFDQFKARIAILNLDIDELRKFMDKIDFPNFGYDNETILAIAHRCRLRTDGATVKQKSESEHWLRQRGLM